jgi:zinc protease
MLLRKVGLIMAGVIMVAGLLAQGLDFDKRLPIDDSVRIGRLENGLTYYIRQNREPVGFADLRLVVNAGSVLENDYQQGLAHFAEHVAFSGTTHFPGNSLIEYLNSLGLGFMGGLNGMTSFDETIYILPSKTDDLEHFEKSFLILSDWAHRVTFLDEAIDKERGIILEEMRGRRGASERIMAQTRREIFGDSRYADRMPIGIQSVIENFEYQVIRDFYYDWYRPDLQAVIAVGDFDIDMVERFIKKYFDDIPAREAPRERPTFPVSIHDEVRFAFATDREATHTSIAIMHKQPSRRIETVGDYKNHLSVNLLSIMINNRLSEISRKPDPPFTSAFASKYDIVRPLSVYTVGAMVDEHKITVGFYHLMTEIQRSRTHGFHQSELHRAKDTLKKTFDRDYQERDKTPSRRLTRLYSNHYLRGGHLLNIEYEYQLLNELLTIITLADVQTAIEQNLTDNNRVITLTAPEDSSIDIPSHQDMLSIIDDVRNTALEPYIEPHALDTLLPKMPKRVRVSKPRYDSKLDMYTWTLKNGARVYLKQTDFRNNEILFSAFRKGGLSTASDDIFNEARVVSQIVVESGLGQLDKTALDIYLSGKDVHLVADLRARSEHFTGNSTTGDVETLLQMMWLNFTAPRYDQQAFDTWKQKTETNIRNLQKSPDFNFSDEVFRVLYDNHLRATQLSVDDLSGLSYQNAFDFFKSRFSSANDFHFFFVGNIDRATLHRYIESYIAPLPNKRVSSRIVDRGIRFAQNSTRKHVIQGQDDKTTIRMMFTNDFRFNYMKNLKMSATMGILSDMLRENVREKISGVYFITASATVESEPFQQVAINISLGCSPDRVEEIITEIRYQINSLKNNDFPDKYIETYKESIRQRIERNTSTNRYWLDQIENMVMQNFTADDIINRSDTINNLTKNDIVETARKYFDFDKELIIILYPEVKRQDL